MPSPRELSLGSDPEKIVKFTFKYRQDRRHDGEIATICSSSSASIQVHEGHGMDQENVIICHHLGEALGLGIAITWPGIPGERAVTIGHGGTGGRLSLFAVNLALRSFGLVLSTAFKNIFLAFFF